jgi:hypothetical protein
MDFDEIYVVDSAFCQHIPVLGKTRQKYLLNNFEACFLQDREQMVKYKNVIALVIISFPNS